MANEFIQTEIKKVMENESFEFPLNHAMASAWILANFKGEDLKVFDLKKSSSLCDFAIIATAHNATQAKSMADEIEFNLKNHGAKVLSSEGYESAEWILLDTGDVMVHIFNGPARDIYDLDMVLVKNPQVKIPEEYYFGTPSMPAEKSDLKGFF